MKAIFPIIVSLVAPIISYSYLMECTEAHETIIQISPGRPCCINAWGRAKCVERNLLDDIKYLQGFTPEEWEKEVARRLAAYKKEKLKAQADSTYADSLKRVNDSVILARTEDSLAIEKAAKAKRRKEAAVKRAAAEDKANIRRAQEWATRVAQFRKWAWSENIIEAIGLQQVLIGMTDAQARESLGAPNSVNRTRTATRTSEQWVYGSGYFLYFENGILTTIQD